MKSTHLFILILLLGLISGYVTNVFSEIYFYKDNSGVRHFTNVPISPEDKEAEKKQLEAQKKQSEAKKKQSEAKKKQLEKDRVNNIRKNYPDWTKADQELVIQHKVRIGMDMDQCRESWGKPHNISNTTTIYSNDSHWCYGEYCSGALFFKDGVLVLIRN